jgi:hypothetical protein
MANLQNDDLFPEVRNPHGTCVIITAPTLRLDLSADRQRLANTVATIKPTLLILDPSIRLHRVDENDASQIASLLFFLRWISQERQGQIFQRRRLFGCPARSPSTGPSQGADLGAALALVVRDAHGQRLCGFGPTLRAGTGVQG